MEDVEKVKPYISHLNKQLNSLKVDLDKLTSKSLDEQLLSLNDERAKLELTNTYAYALSSLMFSYMKVLNVKDLSPIKAELDRVKSYMNKAKAIDGKDQKEQRLQQEEQERAKRVINNALDGRQTGPAISKHNFQGKHTRFEDSTEDQDKQKIDVKEISQKVAESKRKKSRIEKQKVNKKRTK
ncbi:hypothetical protein HG537_0E02680 [Torulaspora globosa]|uniref:Exosome complex protein n=1 Tax=Torulaspora globosa TaxID=48254 RepID=A0A7H9HUK0_9SACH|nr:hypothetical protein HG537_0E02680 [Torulaspora sp. CBS 2947]